MPRFLLALDLGTKRSGAALRDLDSGMIMALDTIEAANEDALIGCIASMVARYKVCRIAVGIPKLLDGTEGAQAVWVRASAQAIQSRLSLPIVFVDERFTSMNAPSKNSADAKAACAIAELAR